MAFVLPTASAIPSGLLPGINLFGQNISNVGLANPVQAAFTGVQALTSGPLTLVNAVSSAANTMLTGGVNSLNTLVLGVLGAPLATASGINLAAQFAFPFPLPGFPGFPSGVLLI